MTEQDTQRTDEQAPLLIERDGHVATWTINRPEIGRASCRERV